MTERCMWSVGAWFFYHVVRQATRVADTMVCGQGTLRKGGTVCTHSGYIGISTILLGPPHYSSFASYTAPPCNHPSHCGIAPSLHRPYPSCSLPLPCYCPCGHGLLLSWGGFIAIASATLCSFNLVIVEDHHSYSVLPFSATPLFATVTTTAF